MAISATCIFEVRTTGNDSNAGGFNLAGSSPGTDRSQQNAAQVFIDGVTITGVVHTTTTQITLVGHTVSSADNRNMLRITGGTATAGLYEITAIDAVNNRWTLDRSAGTAAQTVVGRMGGALLSPNIASGSCNGTGCDIWIRADGVYIISVNAFNGATPGGRMQIAGLSGSNPCHVRGYIITRGDGGRPLLQGSINHATSLIFANGNCVVENIDLDCNSIGTTTGITLATNDRINNCIARNSLSSGFVCSISDAILTNCLAVTCATGFTCSSLMYNCVSRSCTTRGFATSSVVGVYINCIDRASAIGFEISVPNSVCLNCIAYGGTGNGFVLTANFSTYINCIAYGRGGWGFNASAGANSEPIRIINCAGGNNTSGNQEANTTTFPNTVIGFVTLSGDPFVDAVNADFNLITTGAGLQCRNTGYPAGALGQLTLSTSFPDIGAVQENATAATTTTKNTLVGNLGIGGS